jgi:hypothetical protein
LGERYRRYAALISDAIRLAVPMTPAERRRTYWAFFFIVYLLPACGLEIVLLPRFLTDHVIGIACATLTILLCGLLAMLTVDKLLQRERNLRGARQPKRR